MALTESFMLPLGTKASSFILPNVVNGEMQKLEALKGSKGTLIIFMCNHCPYVIHLLDNILKTSEKLLAKKRFHLGFFIYEINNSDKHNYSIHITKKLDKFFEIEGQKYIVNDLENYCCFWIYTKDHFHTFLNSKWWSFKKRAHNFRHNYGITERSSIGFHAFNMNYFKATLIPEVKNQPHPDSFIEHMTNNYYDKFSNLENQNFTDIRGVCKFKIEDVFENFDKTKKLNDNFYLIKMIRLFLWKFRFISRKIN